MELIKLLGLYYDANCYILKHNNMAIVIDPCAPINNIRKELEGYSLKGIFITHGHFDHIVSLLDLLNEYNCSLYANKNALEILSDSAKNCSVQIGSLMNMNIDENRVVFVNDENNIKIDDLTFKTIYTPGHTFDSICIIVNDLMFTGDTLFNRGIGRTDMFSGSSMELRHSLRLLNKIEEDYTIYPGHGEKSSLKNELSRFFR